MDFLEKTEKMEWRNVREIVIVGAARTPIGKFGGTLKDVSAVQLGTYAVKAAIKQAKIDPEEIQSVIFGNVLQAGLGQNPARQIAIHAGIPYATKGNKSSKKSA